MSTAIANLMDLFSISSDPKSFGYMLNWNWSENGVVIKDDDKFVCEFSTRFASRDGLRVIDAIRKSSTGYRVQVSDHGCGSTSVQVFNAGGTLAADVNVAG